MDDLTSVDWASSKVPPQTNGQGQGPRGNYYPTLRPTPPISGRSTPSNVPPKPLSQAPSGTKSPAPTIDSFASLVSFNASQSNKNLSLQEQQRALQEQKAKEEAERSQQFDSHFGKSLAAASGKSVSGSSTPNRLASPPTYSATQDYGGQKLSQIINRPFAGIPGNAASSAHKSIEDDTDILAAFNSSAPVDKSSHMPAAESTDRRNEVLGLGTESLANSDGNRVVTGTVDDDDDPFGLGTSAPPRTSHSTPQKPAEDADDVWGLLNRPASEFPKPQAAEVKEFQSHSRKEDGPFDRAIAELVDMGFTLEKSKLALESTGSGSEVQAAVGWLLNQAHETSRKEKQRQGSSRRDSFGSQNGRRANSRRKSSGSGGPRPAWMKEQGRSGSDPRRQDSKSAAKGERDPAQVAQELGNNLFKSANSLWKTGTKKFNQAVSEFSNDNDASQPKWMREASREPPARRPRPEHEERTVNGDGRVGAEPSTKRRPSTSQPKVTDEALLLESGTARPQYQETRAKVDRHRSPVETTNERIQKPTRPTSPPKPRFMQQDQGRDPRARVNRQAVEEEAAQAYISPARRKRPAAKPAPVPSVDEPDLLFNESKPSRPSQPKSFPHATAPKPAQSPKSITLPRRPPPPKRNIPPISPAALQKAASTRRAGNAAFKRGDYAEAATHYSAAISAIPSSHPLTLPSLTNRALSLLKTGEPKASLADAKAALDFIGPLRGAGEAIDLGGDEGTKPMDAYWGKAMMRQAEAFEQLEKWADAAATWRSCVELGVGGATSIAGRNRCETASKPKPPAAFKRPVPRPAPRPSALSELAPTSAQSAEAVTRLRAANAAADKLDDEKFKLADQVDARILKWRTGKEANLRALLSSLENVLWEGAGWKKVNMGEILQPGKVKIVYMKGIAKVHPDKVSAI